MDKNKLLNHIQVLRGISVLLVFFYHLKLNYFSYGYIGVDIFFVISGYVITSRIYSEYTLNKSFNFINFYKRRFFRIFPVLIFILTFVLLVIIFFQPIDLILGNLKTYLATIFGISNLYFLFYRKDYFDNVFEDTFGHTWSLGVEEQFYLIFPIFFILILKIYKNINFHIYLLSLIIIISIFFTYYFSNNINLIFYSPIFRFWELLLGSLTLILSKKIEKKNSNFSIFLFFLLLVFIINIFNIKNIQLIILSTILTSLFIYFYKENRFANIIFKNKYLVYLGNISYSYYLWHLPIIYFYDLYFVNSFFRIPLLFILILLLSSMTYFFIEEKYRNYSFKKKITYKKISIFFLFCFIFILLIKNLFNSHMNIKDLIIKINYLENYRNYSNRAIFQKISINGNKIYNYCTDKSVIFNLNRENLKKECLKRSSKKRIFYLSGDSFTAQFIPAFTSIKIEDSIYYQHKSDLLKPKDYEKINLLLNYYQDVVFVYHADDEISQQDVIKIKVNDEIKTLLNHLDEKIKILIIGTISNIPEEIDPLKCLIKKIDCKYSTLKDYENRNLKEYYLDIKKFMSLEDRIYFYNPYSAICPLSTCYAYNNKTDLLTHRDRRHLSMEGSLLLKEDLLNFYNNNFK